MVVLLVLFLFSATAIDMVTSPANLNNLGNNGGDILYFFATGLSAAPITYLMILAVLSSTVATMQTTLLPSSRLSFSMARDGVFPKIFGIVHQSWKTPWVGTLITTVLSIVVIAVDVHRHREQPCSATSSSRSVSWSPSTTASPASRARGRSAKCCHVALSLFFFAGVLPLVGGLFLFWIGYTW